MDIEKIKALPDGQLVRAFITARIRRDEAKRAFSKQQEPLLTLLDQLENEAKRRMIERESDGFKSDFGTCYKTTAVSVTTKDKSAFSDYLHETGKWELADIRPAKKEIEAFAENNGGELPPGIHMTSSVEARFRSPSNK
jgi:hypothetical protein